MNTPYENLGYPAGQEFICTATAGWFPAGTRVKLHRDDGDACPWFTDGDDYWALIPETDLIPVNGSEVPDL